MVKDKKIRGFSLLEASVTMLIVAIFVALCAKSFSKRHITHQESDGHGRYECYRNAGGTLVQRYVENNSPRTVSGSTCVFRPPRYAKYLLINLVGGGSSSGAGSFTSVFYNVMNSPLTITPGAKNGVTTVKKGASNIATASGGGGQLIATSTAANTVSSCTFSSSAYTGCGTTANCVQSESNLQIRFCRSNTAGDSQTLELPLSYIKEYRQSYTGSSLVYKDISEYVAHNIPPQEAKTMVNQNTFTSYFTINVTFDTSKNQVSQMGSYLNALGITDGIATANPGAVNSYGAVLILW